MDVAHPKKSSKKSKKEITLEDISILSVGDALSYYPTEKDKFFAAKDGPEILRVREFLNKLPDSSSLPVRGRDWTKEGAFTEWIYGYAVKVGECLFFLYSTGLVESFGIADLNFRDLVHFAKVKQNRLFTSAPKMVDPTKVVIISHGWSQRLGPNYPFIRTLEKVAWHHGWKVIIPDFRAAYKFGSSRSRSERVRTIYEEIICLDPKPTTLVLVGHSQGGAASAHACTDRIVKSANVKGLCLMGSENPGSLDGMAWKPAAPNLLFVHADNDQTITIGENESIAKFWGAPFITLKSTVAAGKFNAWGDDINHDFLTAELMSAATKCFLDFLALCEKS